MLASAAIREICSAIFRAWDSDSITQGPAIRNRGLLAPRRREPSAIWRVVVMRSLVKIAQRRRSKAMLEMLACFGVRTVFPLRYVLAGESKPRPLEEVGYSTLRWVWRRAEQAPPLQSRLSRGEMRSYANGLGAM